MNKQGLRFKQEEDKVYILLNGGLIAVLPHDAALAAGTALKAVGKLAEEYASALDIIKDDAFLRRMGVPISLTENPKMVKESIKESIYNKQLRKWIPFAKIDSSFKVHTPSIKNTKEIV